MDISYASVGTFTSTTNWGGGSICSYVLSPAIMYSAANNSKVSDYESEHLHTAKDSNDYSVSGYFGL